MKRWFGPKVFGIGIGPRSWEGGVATLVFVIGALLIVRGLHPLVPHVPVWAFEGSWLALFLLVVALTYGGNSTAE